MALEDATFAAEVAAERDVRRSELGASTAQVRPAARGRIARTGLELLIAESAADLFIRVEAPVATLPLLGFTPVSHSTGRSGANGVCGGDTESQRRPFAPPPTSPFTAARRDLPVDTRRVSESNFLLSIALSSSGVAARGTPVKPARCDSVASMDLPAPGRLSNLRKGPDSGGCIFRGRPWWRQGDPPALGR